MLILKRNEGEKIVMRLPSGAEITVVAVQCGRSFTRMGIEAPRDVSVCREEVWAKIKAEREAGQTQRTE